MFAMQSSHGLDLSTRESQIANIKAVRQRIATGRLVKGEPTRSPAVELLATHDTHNGSVGALSAGVTLDDPSRSPVPKSVLSFPQDASPSVAAAPHPFDFCAFRTAPIEGEAEPAKVNFPMLVRVVAAELELYPAAIWGLSREAQIVFAKQAVWWLARRWTKLSFPQIARLSTSRYRRGVPMDHSTILSGHRRFEDWRQGEVTYGGKPSYQEWVARRG